MFQRSKEEAVKDSKFRKWVRFAIGAVLIVAGCDSSGNNVDLSSLSDPPEVTIGERLFLETRFAQFFASESGGDVNATLPEGDPVMDTTESVDGSLPGPFKRKSMNCRACHLVDEQFEESGGGMRTYADFARRSPLPDRGDNRLVTARNSPPLVNATLARSASFFLHFDGEFATLDDLVGGTLTGRNFGWLPTEQAGAVAHIASVIRDDDGQGDLGLEFGGWSYADLLLGTDDAIPDGLRLPEEFRVDVTAATDQEILDAVAKLISTYVDGLRFSQDADGNYNASPYDVFLQKNNLPRQPDSGETEIDYSARLLGELDQLSSPKFVAHDGSFGTHSQSFVFGAQELTGLKIFLRQAASPLATGVGNCAACHPAPNFTDFRFHNTGVTQREFDELHGDGAFMGLTIPDLASRQADLPATAAHPNGTGKFLAVPSLEPGHEDDTDLGLWNVFANGDVPAPQGDLQVFMCDEFGAQAGGCTDAAALLPFSIAYFKTPSLRDLGHSNPYMHNGQFDALSDVIAHYQLVGALARDGVLRNGSDELEGIRMNAGEAASVAKFLKALNEDYE